MQVMRPAVNVGLSVSRVGGAAQTKAMKKGCRKYPYRPGTVSERWKYLHSSLLTLDESNKETASLTAKL